MDSTEPRSLLEPRRVGLLALIVAVAIGTLALGLPRIANSNQSEGTVVERRQVVDPPRALTDFTLTDQNGEAMNLSDLAGRPVLLFFGFTHCPDICPTTLAQYRAIKRELGDHGESVAFVLVSVDGTRDTPEVLKAYVERFDPAFIGLTGEETYVRQLGSEYYLFFSRSVGVQSAAGYLVEHTSYSYLIDAEGRLRIIYPFQAPITTIVDDLRRFATESGSLR